MTDKKRIEFEHLKKQIFSDDWETVKSSGDRLGQIGGDEVIDFLISLLPLENSIIRGRAALALRDIKDNRAVEPLLKAIFKKGNQNYTGVMVYALTELDCSNKLKEIFKILIYQGFEPKQHAYRILSDQVFTFTRKDLLQIQKMWNEIQLHPDRCPGYDQKETREMLKGTVDGYMSYLKSESKKKNSAKKTPSS